MVVNCASPISYWKEHPELYPAQLVIGGQVYKADDLIEIFSDQTEDLSAKLQAQLAAVYMNIISGADQSYIETTIFEAYGWLVQHPAGSQVSDSEHEVGTRLFNVLEEYNLGLTGIAPCVLAVTPTVTATSTITEAPTILSTITVNPTLTLNPSESSTPTRTSTRTIRAGITPSRTPIATTGLPGYPSYTPTRTSIPSATYAPVNTTAAPPPTTTSTYTPIPTSTSTPIPPSPTPITPSPTPITPTQTPEPTLPPTQTPEPTLPPTSTPEPTLPPPF
jgi:hypothetical protein